MTTSTDRVEEIFQDARELQADALEMLDQGRVRNAAEKAWGATKRATEALILSLTGEVPANSTRVSAELRALGREDEKLRALTDRFGATARFLHNDCFYNGSCDPIEDTECRVRETSGYIDDAERIVGADPFSRAV